MKTAEFVDQMIDWAREHGTAPYGVMSGVKSNSFGRKYTRITFGRARTVDITVDIYNTKFVVIRTSQDQFGASNICRSPEDTFAFLQNFC